MTWCQDEDEHRRQAQDDYRRRGSYGYDREEYRNPWNDCSDAYTREFDRLRYEEERRQEEREEAQRAEQRYAAQAREREAEEARSRFGGLDLPFTGEPLRGVEGLFRTGRQGSRVGLRAEGDPRPSDPPATAPPTAAP